MQPYAFVLAVPDITATAAYFEQALGFTRAWTEADDWRLLSRGAVRIMIGQCPDAMPAHRLGDHSWFAYLHVDDVDALYEEFHTRGALIRTPPHDQPYGQREMLVATPDGHRMVFAQTLARGETPTAPPAG